MQGFGPDDVSRPVVHDVHVIGDHRDVDTAWRAVVGWFDGNVPAATLLGVTLLGHVDQVVEIDATVQRVPS